MLEEIFQDARDHMEKSIEVMKKDFLTLRPGK